MSTSSPVGRPWPDLEFGNSRFTQLPPARIADLSFKTLIDVNGCPVDDGWRAGRRAILLDLFAQRRPDVVITELFPFGRRILEFELLPLLEAAAARRPRPLIVSSVRDILAAKTDPAKIERMVARVRERVRPVLVHGDRSFIPLAASFAAEDEIADRVAYTGYIEGTRSPAPPPGTARARSLSPSAAARSARDFSKRRLRHEHCRTAARGSGASCLAADVPPAAREQLLQAGASGVVVEPARADFPGLLARCHVSVSQAGYNTVVDLLTAGAGRFSYPLPAAARPSRRCGPIFWRNEAGRKSLMRRRCRRRVWRRRLIARLPDPALASGLVACGGAATAVRLLEAALTRSDGRHSLVADPGR